MSLAQSSSSVRVRYAETDQMGVAYHGGFFAWFEVGRTDLLRHKVCTYRELEAEDLRLPVIEANVRFLRPALYDDVLEIQTRLVEMTGARLRFVDERRGIEFGAEADVGHDAARGVERRQRQQAARDARAQLAARAGIERIASRDDALPDFALGCPSLIIGHLAGSSHRLVRAMSSSDSLPTAAFSRSRNRM